MMQTRAYIAADPGITIDPETAIHNGRLLLLGVATLVMVFVGIKVIWKNHTNGDTSKALSVGGVVFIGAGIIALASVPLITGVGSGVLTAIVTFFGGHV